MHSTLPDSIVFISSQNHTQPSSFGTGFVFYQNEEYSYILTCFHVLEAVGSSSDKIYIDGMSASIVCSGEDQGIDLAVVKVVRLLNKQPIALSISGGENQNFVVAGFYSFSHKTNPLLRHIKGRLGQKVEFVSNNQRASISAWDLNIEGKHRLEPGYSGSPVIDEEHGHAIGIVSYRIGSGSEGLAISVCALEKIWADLPLGLIKPFSKETDMTTHLPLYVLNKIERIKEDIELNESQISELKNVINLVSDEINENIDNLVRVDILKKRRKRYENDKDSYVQKNELLFMQIESLKEAVP